MGDERRPLIATEHLLLQPHHPDDFEEWVSFVSDQSLYQYIGWPNFTREDLWNRLLRFAGHWSLFGWGLFLVRARDTGAVLGETGFADFHRGLGPDFDPAPEAAWIFARAVQGSGFAREAAQAAHAWRERAHGAARTVCIIDPANAPSLRVAARLAYRVYGEAIYREKTVLKLERVPVGG